MHNPLAHITLDKELRRDIDAIIQRLKAGSSALHKTSTPGRPMPICPNCYSNERVGVTSQLSEALQAEGVFFCPCNEAGPRCFTPRSSRERSIAITKLQEAVMWLGMDLKAINDENQPAEEEIEKLAETIFYEMQKYSPEGVHPWVPRGNSIMQDQARRLAREQVAIIANPYPSSKDPSTGAKIEPTADGLKL